MVSGKTRRIVVIKDIPSNMIEEAILILKGEPGTEDAKDSKEGVGRNKKRDNDYLMKEALYVINNYIKENRLVGDPGVHLTLREAISKKKSMISMGINLALAGSLVLLGFLVIKLI